MKKRGDHPNDKKAPPMHATLNTYLVKQITLIGFRQIMKMQFFFLALIFLLSAAFSQVTRSQVQAAPVQFIPLYVEPYYVAGQTASEPPKVNVWSEIDGLLASLDKERILEAKKKIESDPTRISPMTLMVLAVRLFDVGLRDDAVFWFYVAKERYLVTEKVLRIQSAQLSGVGDAMNSFNALAGPFINGFAFCNPDRQINQREAATAWNEQNTYVALFLEDLPALSGNRKDNLRNALATRRESLVKEREYLAKPETRSQLIAGRKANAADEKYCNVISREKSQSPATKLPSQDTAKSVSNITTIELKAPASSIAGLTQGTMVPERGMKALEAEFNGEIVKLGCPQERMVVRPYLLTEPTASEHGDTWKERWFLPNCEEKYIDIEFRVDKAGLFKFRLF